MKRPCAEPRCGALLDGRDGPWRYCDAHRTEDKEADAAEDEARAMLEAASHHAHEIIEYLNIATERHPGLRQLAEDQLRELHWLEDAMFFGTTGTVALHALMAGSRRAIIDAYLTEHGLRDRIAAMAADADRGRRSVQGAREGGKLTRKALDADTAFKEVTDLLARKPNLSTRRACELIGKEHNVSYKTVERRYQEAIERTKAKL